MRRRKGSCLADLLKNADINAMNKLNGWQRAWVVIAIVGRTNAAFSDSQYAAVPALP
jgi:hypothetical protein